MRSARCAGRLCLAVILCPLAPAAAQVGPLGASVGLPANPFTSNDPSAPPRVERRSDEAAPRRLRRPVRASHDPRPPADVPGR